MASFQNRVIGAIQLQTTTFEEVEHDASATGQAAAVVAFVGVANGIFAVRAGLGSIPMAVIVQLLGWGLASFVLLLVGTKLLPGRSTEADWGQMLRTVGFAESAGVFNILGFVPVLGGLLPYLTGAWILIAMVVAVRQALDYESTTRAIVVCIIAWVLSIGLSLIGSLLGLTGTVVSSSPS